MKPSLWDLKQSVSSFLTGSLGNHEAIPMGFETNGGRFMRVKRLDHEAIPMGFETYPFHNLVGGDNIMKPSLWDLKPG